MIQNGLNLIYPHSTDFSLLHTFGATQDTVDGLPKGFSIYDGRTIPDQNGYDNRFNPAIQPLPLGCVGEGLTFAAGLEDNALYDPRDFYLAVPPGTMSQGRDIRTALGVAINRGFKDPAGNLGNKRTAYFNCYGSGAIDDFDAARIGLYLNAPIEKRAVIVGTWWYPEFENAGTDGILPVPSYKTSQGSLHCHIITGFESTYKDDYLEDISWQGTNYGNGGLDYISRDMYNRLLAQPWTGAFTISKLQGKTPVPIGIQAEIDHVIYYVRNLFHV